MQIKQQWDTTAHLLKWWKFKTWATPNAGEYVEQQKLLFIAGGNAGCHRHFGRPFGGFLQN